jgi:lysophospholipase L1-like esterase
VDVKKILFDDDAAILPPSPYQLEKPVVFYGTSITQGGCASRAGLSYQGMLCRELNLDFVNLGFSGLGKGERVVAEAAAQIDAACYVLDFGQNNPSLEEFRQVYEPFICKLREYRKETPILLTTPITYTSEKWNKEFREFQNQRRQIVTDAYQSRKAAGDRNIHLAEWNKLICFQDGEGQVDGAHPNDIGLSRMSKGLRGILADILGLDRQA